MRRIYLASPYRGNVELNKAYARACVADAIKRGEAPFAPHLLYTDALDDSKDDDRKKGIGLGYRWLMACDGLVAYVDLGVSEGMELEIEAARSYRIPISYRVLDPRKVERIKESHGLG